MKIEGDKEREKMRRKQEKKYNHHLTIRFGAGGRGKYHANRKLAPSDRGILERADKKTPS